ncbi:hypothetical protein [Microcoleus sp. CAWBG58]|uniref:hypothetical protein n=1 Tax=Microcoleus sp. CAWBG58 TaxID=2841651 RepID=UPI0025F09B22|nr:hypothetical protein [Microcoleus sp. CAWBG58]
MTIATTEPPRITTRMTTEEAEEITEAIRGNFDSLGKMLLQVQERKGFLALGYKSLESYCLTEFGKGKSRLYQVIEEARIEEEIVSELSEEGERKTLKIPGTCLRTLKNLSLPGQKVEAIKYANLLAEQEGRKRATKLHLQVAALKIGGQGSEQLRKSIEEMGFAKGVEVEFTGGYNKGNRGIIQKINQKGEIYVEIHSGNSVLHFGDIHALKVVHPDDKPKNPATEDTVRIGDNVKIFSSNHLRGKIGKIAARINNKQALVKVDDNSGSAEIPYAEIELIQVLEEQQSTASWDEDLSWGVPGEGNWFYTKDSCTIRSFGCPAITLHPDKNKKKFAGPSEWLKWWKERHGCELASDLLDPEQIATLVMTAAIRMTEDEKQKFLRRINVLLTTTITKCEKTTKPANTEHTAAEQAVEQAAESLVEITPENPTPGEATAPTEFLVEITPENSSPNWQKDWLAKTFPTRPEAAFSITQGSLSEQIEQKIENLLDKADELVKGLDSKSNSSKSKRDVRLAREKEIKSVRQLIKDLEVFKSFQIGMLVSHQRNPSQIGIIANLALSVGGMPEVCVKWEEDSIEFPEIVSLISIQDEEEEW